MNITGKLNISPPTDEVIKLDQEFFPFPWGPKQWHELNMDLHRLYLWENSKELIGFALLSFVPYDSVAHLFKIVLRPNYRNRGESQVFWSSIQRDLIQSGMEQVYLEVQSSNSMAIRFYEKCGFKLLRIHKAFYSSGENAFIMSLML